MVEKQGTGNREQGRGDAGTRRWGGVWMVRIVAYICCLVFVVSGFAIARAQAPGVEPIWDLEKYRQVSALWDESDEYFHEGNYEAAVRTLEKIIEIDPTDSQAYVDAGWLLESSDRVFEGFDMYVRNVIANHRNCDSYFELGTKYYYMGAYDLAVQKIEAGQIYPCDPVVTRMLAHAYERAGRREEAIQTFASILGKDPNDGAALINLMRILDRVPPEGDPTRLWHRPAVKDDPASD